MAAKRRAGGKAICALNPREKLQRFAAMPWLGLYRGFWISALVALMAVGAPLIGKPKSTRPLVPGGRDSSVNFLLLRTLGEAELAPRITEWMAELPRGRAIFILIPPENAAAALTADLLSYLAWPRPVVVSSDREQSTRLLGHFPERFCAVGLCFLPAPAALPPGKSFGRSLQFISSEPTPE